MTRRRRKLTQEEVELWQKVSSATHPMHETTPKSLPKPKPPRPKSTTAIPDFSVGQAAMPALPGHNLAPAISDHVASAPLAMDRKRHGQMTKGKMVPEARIDLHGMTIAQAHPALTGFVQRSHAQGKRLILVITGKGKSRDEGGPIPVRHGVLKHAVPHWLSLAPLRPLILQVREAHLKHGGSGAYYVYLRSTAKLVDQGHDRRNG